MSPPVRDIAAKASVSQSTVSRVLNDAPTRVPIAAETRERVIEAARELGYRPNPLARALRGAPTNLMGAVVRDFSDPFFANAIERLAVEAMATATTWSWAMLTAGWTVDPLTRSSRPATPTPSSCSATCRTSRACSPTCGRRRSGRRPMAGREPARVPDDGCRRQGGRRRRGSAPRPSWATADRVRQRRLPGDNRQREAALPSS